MHEKKSEGKNPAIQTLAIASVPCQQWSETYEPEQALEVGTLFPELNKPFYAASTLMDGPESGTAAGNAVPEAGKAAESGMSGMLREIDAAGFAVNDLTLYLDTHESDAEALSLFARALVKKQELMKSFAAKYYPLTQTCMAGEGKEGTHFRWTDGPAPWEPASAEPL